MCVCVCVRSPPPVSVEVAVGKAENLSSQVRHGVEEPVESQQPEEVVGELRTHHMTVM